MKFAPWHPIDRTQLRAMVTDFLAESELLPTHRNAGSILDSGMRCAASGDPCIVAVQDGDLLGFLYWYGLQGVDTTLKTLCAQGSYVVPVRRHKGIGSALRLEGRRQARDAGYQRIIYAVNLKNDRGIAEHTRLGAWPTMVQFEERL